MERYSDGGEDQGAEEVTVMGQKKAKKSSRQFWKEPSRASGSSFQRVKTRHEGIMVGEDSDTFWLMV